jgi:two-component system LytT family response regulator
VKPAPIRVLVVDDEALARRRLLGFLRDEPELRVIGEADSGSKAVEAIAGQRPDLVFLDVQMPGLDGFGVLRCVAGAHLPAVVFVTAHDQHAIRAFEVHAVDYLLKPVTAARFHQAVTRAIARIRTSSREESSRSIEALLARVGEPEPLGPRIPIRRDGRIGFVAVADIEWVEADGDHLQLHAGREVHTLRATLTELEAKLPADRFVRVHRSLIVNLGRVREVESVPKGDYVLILTDGTRLRSGRSYRETVQRLIRLRERG